MRSFLFAQSWNVLLMHACDVIIAVYLQKPKPVPLLKSLTSPSEVAGVSGAFEEPAFHKAVNWGNVVVMVIFLESLVMSWFSKAGVQDPV